MFVWRHRPKGGLAPFGLGLLTFVLIPSEIGHQELAALIARQPVVAERAFKHVLPAAFATVHNVSLSMPEPFGGMPVPLSYALAGLDTGNAEVTGSIRERILGDMMAELSPGLPVVPKIERRLKGDRLIAALPPDPDPEAAPIRTSELPSGRKGDRLLPRTAETATEPPVVVELPRIALEPEVPEAETASEQPAEEAPSTRQNLALQTDTKREPTPEKKPEPSKPEPPASPRGDALAPVRETAARDTAVADAAPIERVDEPVDAAEQLAPGFAAPEDLVPAVRLTRLYFGADPMGQTLDPLKPWEEGEAPNVETWPVAVDHDAKVAALPPEPGAPQQTPVMQSEAAKKQDKLPSTADEHKDGDTLASKDAHPKGGETIAAKGEVTGADQRPMSPAERLKLDEAGRAKAEKCLSAAIYYESRGEPVRGQIAVAQVVLNRVFSGYYPTTVCGVVYQNAHRHLACQFTFACDGIREVVREPDAMDRAKKIAAQVLDGQLWLPEVGKATHYHAYWVRPGWVREMTKMYKLGVHTFYRPRKWGDGADKPEWGDAAATAAAAKQL